MDRRYDNDRAATARQIFEDSTVLRDKVAHAQKLKELEHED